MIFFSNKGYEKRRKSRMRKKEYYKKKNVGWGGFRMVKNKVKKRTEEKEERMK